VAQDPAPRVRVKAIPVGTIETDATRAVADGATLRAEVDAATPLRRLGTVEDVAAVVTDRSSPAAAFVTGITLEVDGGAQAPFTAESWPDLWPGRLFGAWVRGHGSTWRGV
jgi:7-alpha-hydroxysteroid dehydrogenase